MKSYVELWKVKESWKSLSKEERANYLSKLAPAIQHFAEKGVEVVGWGENDEETSKKADYDYFAIWNFPNDELVMEFENLVEEAGWYNYFEQVNICGKPTSPEEILGKLVEI
ncbi:DUF6616 family protein [Tunicatimonas pelagia]|uniref:DUF6616 family protein n=1 Tax=Tunicatimonas pelagia TaxID=931531 RepID=UPI00266605B5|nr:DUF6616 family protein [Tunicatimonas pelagia]WKN42931.1 hypothetical protein P0M28_28235 [Tunicatimonas pelagia]